MTVDAKAFDQLVTEHLALSRQYGAVQARCSRVVGAQRDELVRLEAEVVRLRAAVIVRDTALAQARANQAALEASIPGLPKRAVLAQRVEWLMGRIHGLLRERLHWQSQAAPPKASAAMRDLPMDSPGADLRSKSVLCVGDEDHTGVTRRVVELAGGQWLRFAPSSTDAARADNDAEDLAALEASLIAADLVICQTGCLSHGAYWRVQDHCRRTGKTCVMVDQPQAPRAEPTQVIRIVRGADATGGKVGPRVTEPEA